mmetsp:Transcript_19987/g.30448  ORF Transcript_19987/g.30448 Transcript_19987/m.30448 type:complete len:91 (-) Transcript_19987:5-277(-)
MLGRKKINKYGKPYICVVVEEDHQVSKDYKRKEGVAQAIDDDQSNAELVTRVLQRGKESDVSNFSLLESQSKQPTTIEEEEENLPYEDAG